MRKLFLCITAIISACFCNLTAGSNLPGDSLTVFCSSGLYSLVHDWAEGFNSVNSGSKVSVAINTREQLPVNSISIVEGSSPGSGDSEWVMAVGRDVIIPVINADNPLKDKIRTTGLSPENLALFIKQPASGNWGTLLGTQDMERAGFYIMNDEVLIKALTTYLDVDIRAHGRTMTPDANELFSALVRDPLGIGFCKMASLTNNLKTEFAGKIIIAPIDRNGDGTLDHNEQIYEDMVAFSRGIWIGKYPRALSGIIYTVVTGHVSDSQAAFLRWILNDGQSYLIKAGFTKLLAGERQRGKDRLAELTVPVPPADKYPVTATLIFISVLLVLFILLLKFIFRSGVNEASPSGYPVINQKILDENSLILPAGLLFDSSHMWSFMEQNGTVKVGIDDYLNHATGEITRIVMKQKGDFVRKGDEIVSLIRNGKHLTVYAPVSGIIREKNLKLEGDTNILNKSPYDEGWIYRVEPLGWANESKLLIMSDKYREIIRTEILKLKEFLARYMNKDHPQCYAVLQDGGALLDNPLAEMGPEVWEEFQTKFIDSAKTH